MPPKTLLLTLAATAAVLLLAPPVQAVGFASPQATVLLGSPMALVALAEPSGKPSAAAKLAAGAQTLAAGNATQAAHEQIVLLEGQMLQSLTDAKRQQAQMMDLRHRLDAAEAVNGWLPWLVLSLVAAAAGVVWLALRLRRLQREPARRDWQVADIAQYAAPVPVARPSAQAPLLTPDPGLLSGSAVAQALAQPVLAASPLTRPPPTAPTQAGESGRAPVSFSMGTGVPPRPVSVEELLDLDQQVDFFMVLGQEQAAIDLLLSHVRATGGSSALPYFKLLEIYRKQGDEEAYERTRERFNLRFNAVAPDWQGDMAAGRCLADHPEVVQRLQRAWPQPLRAAAELDALLLRRADLEPFDLPAFHDLLTLHALVSDLPAAPANGWAPVAVPSTVPGAASWVAADADAVDLLLPLGDGPLEITLPRPRLSEPGAARAMLADWVFSRTSHRLAADGTAALPTLALDSPPRPAKLDLDLSDFAPAPREFTRPAAFTDVDMRRDGRISDLAAFDDSDLLPPSISRR